MRPPPTVLGHNSTTACPSLFTICNPSCESHPVSVTPFFPLYVHLESQQVYLNSVNREFRHYLQALEWDQGLNFD